MRQAHSRVLPAAGDTGSVPDGMSMVPSRGKGPGGRRFPDSGGYGRADGQPLPWEKILRTTYLELCEGLAGVGTAAPKADTGADAGASGWAGCRPVCPHPSPTPRAPEGRPTSVTERRVAIAASPAALPSPRARGPRAVGGLRLHVSPAQALVWKHRLHPGPFSGRTAEARGWRKPWVPLKAFARS